MAKVPSMVAKVMGRHQLMSYSREVPANVLTVASVLPQGLRKIIYF